MVPVITGGVGSMSNMKGGAAENSGKGCLIFGD